MRYFILFLLVVTLLGCTTEEGRAVKKQELANKVQNFNGQIKDKGCSIEFIGYFPMENSSDIPIVLASCSGKVSTSVNTMVRDGKFTKPKTTIFIEDLDSQINELTARKKALEKLTDEDKAALGIK